MYTIHLTTFISQSADIVFDLGRHVGLQRDAMSDYQQEAVAGTRFGLLESGETITWRARHFFQNRLMRLRVLEMIAGDRLILEQAMGPFQSFRQERYVKACENGSILIDLVHYEWKQGRLGQIANQLFLGRYLEKMLNLHIEAIRRSAEGPRWKTYLMK
ncbi:MAG: SRPBCC family protein [Bacteroidota bacterium]